MSDAFHNEFCNQFYCSPPSRVAAQNQAQNLQQSQMPMSPQPGQTGRGASVVSNFARNYMSMSAHIC